MLALRVSGLLLAGLLASEAAHADLKNFYYQRYLKKKVEAGSVFKDFLPFYSLSKEKEILGDTAELTFDQRIDPKSETDTRTFKQRYFLNSTFASGPSAPIFFYICGEATCSPGDLNGVIKEYAKKYKAHL